MATTIEREAELIALSDEQLVERVYGLVQQVLAIDDPLAQELYFHLQEAFERFAPVAGWADVTRNAPNEYELQSSLERIRGRWEARRRHEAGLPAGDDA